MIELSSMIPQTNRTMSAGASKSTRVPVTVPIKTPSFSTKLSKIARSTTTSVQTPTVLPLITESSGFSGDYLFFNSQGSINGTVFTDGNWTDFNATANASNATTIYKFGDEFQNFLIFCYTLSCILAVVGNIICIVVFIEQRRMARQSGEIYFYLINLAVCDILMAIFCIPFTAINYLHEWIFPEFFCKVVLFCQMCFVFASIGTNICVSVHRLTGILRPQSSLSSHTSLVISMLLIVWLVSALVSLINFIIGGISTTKKCGEVDIPSDLEAIWQWAVSTLMLFLPMAVIIFIYCWIGYILYQRPKELGQHQPVATTSSRRPNSVVSAEERRSDQRKMITVTLFCVALCFCIGWTPLHVFFITLLLNPTIGENYPMELNYVYAFCHLLAMSHSFHNPVVYIFSSKHFRETMFRLFRCKKEDKRGYSQRTRTIASDKHSMTHQSEMTALNATNGDNLSKSMTTKK